MRARRHLPNTRTKWHGTDDAETFATYMREHHDASTPPQYRVDDEWEYAFNSLGYRGDEIDLAADVKIYAVGCSVTFGMGVKLEQTWPWVFARLYREQHPGLSLSLANFSQGGASNDYIARQAIIQCEAAPPEVLLVQFTQRSRKEHVEEGQITNLGPHGRFDLEQLNLGIYSDEEGVISSVKNILLVQYFCLSRRIPYLFCWHDYWVLREKRFVDHPVCGPLIALVDIDHFHPRVPGKSEFQVDLARDAKHAGPISNEKFAQALFELYFEKYGGSG